MYLKMVKDLTRADVMAIATQYRLEGDEESAKDFEVFIEAIDKCSEGLPEDATLENIFDLK